MKKYISTFVQINGYVTTESLRTASVHQEARRTMESALNLGTFWPIDIYRAHKGGRNPPPGEVTTHVHGGRAYQGVLLDPTVHGSPPGIDAGTI